MKTLTERLERLYEPAEDGCWNWTAYRDRDGYGRVQVGEVGWMAHRAMLHSLGIDMTGMEVDHLCRNRACVNPAHLEVVTRAENNRRMHRDNPPFGRRQSRAPLTHCPNNHEFTPENTYISPGRSSRTCRTCIRAATARYQQRKRDAA